MVRDPVTGKYRRTRLFVMTLGYSRKSVRKRPTRLWITHNFGARVGQLGGVE